MNRKYIRTWTFIAAAAALCALPTGGEAQELTGSTYGQQGTLTVQGGLSVASTTATDIEGVENGSSEYAIAPSLGYFVADGLLLEGGLSFGSSSSDSSDFESSSFALGAAANYFLDLSGGAAQSTRWLPYAGLGLAYGGSESGEIETSNTDVRPYLGLALATGADSGGFARLELGYLISSRTASFLSTEVEVDVSGLVLGLGYGLYF